METKDEFGALVRQVGHWQPAPTATTTYTFTRVGAAVSLKVED